MSNYVPWSVRYTDDKSAEQKEDKMKRAIRKKRHKRYRKDAGVTGKILSVALVIFFSVFAGYITAAHLIGPMLGLESEVVFSDFIKDKKDTQNKEAETDQKQETKVVQDELPIQTERGFALQYGSFSAKDGAQQCVEELKADGIDASIIEKDGSYKVIGEVFETKEDARNQKDTSTAGKDIFITEIP